MNADERMTHLVNTASIYSLRVLCLWLWGALKSRLNLSGGGSYYDDLAEWATRAERVAGKGA